MNAITFTKKYWRQVTAVLVLAALWYGLNAHQKHQWPFDPKKADGIALTAYRCYDLATLTKGTDTFDSVTGNWYNQRVKASHTPASLADWDGAVVQLNSLVFKLNNWDGNVNQLPTQSDSKVYLALPKVCASPRDLPLGQAPGPGDTPVAGFTPTTSPTPK